MMKEQNIKTNKVKRVKHVYDTIQHSQKQRILLIDVSTFSAYPASLLAPSSRKDRKSSPSLNTSQVYPFMSGEHGKKKDNDTTLLRSQRKQISGVRFLDEFRKKIH